MTQSNKDELGMMSMFRHHMKCFVVSTSLVCSVSIISIVDAPRAFSQSPAYSQPQTLIYDGFTEPQHDIMVAAAEVGLLLSMEVEIGDAIKAGQIIGRLDEDVQVSAVKLAELQANMRGNEDAARVEAELQRQRVGMVRTLAAKDMARPDELRRTEADLEIAEARLVAAQEQSRLRRLELERYQLQLQRRKIVAPVSGVIAELFREPGEYVSPSDPVIARLLVMDRLIGVFNVPAEEIGRLSVGTPARVFLRSNGNTIDTKISSIAPDIDGESGTVQVRVELDNIEHQLRAGDRCTLSILSSSQRNHAKAKQSVSQRPDRSDLLSPQGATR
ncbi:secretion protein HlyD family protein [Rhodopirellula maiorica SM1]|uniref:Secretion protein HlyD family protein n=1 Tax=Rhodopirellula maiorica SM1 TaxID=1265738 RepID=M5RNT4_9BACT|nr:efflux RND transporter periplasmic adaptor subunit [Rhodopirellula maiorica]EMI15639.1 secretion protein HlyD family protein [Rhodopirellula maiorica SM1]